MPAAALIHEAGHVAAARLRGRRIERLTLSLTGAVISTRGGRRSYRDDAAVAFWGAGANLCALPPTLLLYRAYPDRWLLCFFFANLALALFNLLPARPLDGGALLYALICRRSSPETADKILRKTQKISLALIFAAGLWLFAVFRNASLMLIFVSFLCSASGGI